jgi:hypothetical protein
MHIIDATHSAAGRQLQGRVRRRKFRAQPFAAGTVPGPDARHIQDEQPAYPCGDGRRGD